VSALGLGMAAIGRPGYLNLEHGDDLSGRTAPADLEAHAFELLDAAWDAGISYIDAARSYGRAEAYLASWLEVRGLNAHAARPTIGSKWGYAYVGGWRTDTEVHEVKDLSADQLARQYGESRAMLGDRLDLLQIHSATVESGVLEDATVLDRLRTIRADGTPVGITTTGPDQATTIRRALEVSVDGAPLFDTVQATWNLLEPSAQPALAEACDTGMAVIVKEALANGRLAGRDDAVGRRLTAADPDLTPDQVGLGAALAQPWVTVVLSGATTLDQLRSNLGGLTPAARSAGSELATTGELTEQATTYWANRSSLAWT